ncbi:MAG: hypothetical protein JO310_15285 [Hyphomicrobiales bacterium]|nr:hypothetical protein [Hyphomicrobiales bacterium]
MRLLIIAAAVVLGASPALAQWQGGRSDGDRRGGDNAYRSTEGNWPGSGREDREAEEGWGPRRDRIGSDRSAPFIRLRANGVEITLRCGEADSIRACVDAASTLIDRAGATRTMARAGAGDATPGSQPPAARQP